MSKRFCKLSDEILNVGRKRFGAMMGIVSHIHEGTYEIVAVSTDTGIPVVGDTYYLDAVYCRDVFLKKKTIAITEIDGAPGMCLHPLYKSIPCEFYISAPIFLEGKVWGTLNFTSLEKQVAPFSEEDIQFIETQAHRLNEQLMLSA